VGLGYRGKRKSVKKYSAAMRQKKFTDQLTNYIEKMPIEGKQKKLSTRKLP